MHGSIPSLKNAISNPSLRVLLIDYYVAGATTLLSSCHLNFLTAVSPDVDGTMPQYKNCTERMFHHRTQADIDVSYSN